MTRLALAAAAAVGAAAIVVGGVGSGSVSAQQSCTRTITLLESVRETKFHIVDVPPTSKTKREPTLSPGDFVVVHNPVRDESQQRIGSSYSEAMTIVGGKGFERATFMGDLVLVLRDGQITTHGILSASPTSVIAITGGTGAYAGARGTFTTKRGNGDFDHDTVCIL
jgi:hypothetical protein